MPRQTADLIALVLTGVVAIVIILTTLVLLWLALHGQSVGQSADAIGKIISVLIGALVGFMAGRRINGNGNH